MSDSAIASIITGVVTVMTAIIGFLTLWVKLKYGEAKIDDAARRAAVVEGKIDDVQASKRATLVKVAEVSDKLDNNTAITTQAKDAAEEASAHATNCDGDRIAIAKMVSDHSSRIVILESQMTELKCSVDEAGKNIDSTRHEMRSQLQAVMNKLDLIMLRAPSTKDS
jgi:predicted  nucleic acid-binding Zn-ribbon protein